MRRVRKSEGGHGMLLLQKTKNDGNARASSNDASRTIKRKGFARRCFPCLHPRACPRAPSKSGKSVSEWNRKQTNKSHLWRVAYRYVGVDFEYPTGNACAWFGAWIRDVRCYCPMRYSPACPATRWTATISVRPFEIMLNHFSYHSLFDCNFQFVRSWLLRWNRYISFDFRHF